VLECVINVSEGRDARVLRALANACGPALLDLHADADHHRSVFTIGGPGARDAEAGARRLADAVAERVSIIDHEGVHPRFGALDVVPFVAVGGTPAEVRVAQLAARKFARWWSETHGVPVFVYDDADPNGRDLPHARLHAFRSRPADFGPPAPHPTLGASAVGARRPLAALNCLLVTGDIVIARQIARAIRERNGGLKGVRSLAFMLAREGRAQVSINIVDLTQTSVEDACLTVRELARKAGTDVAKVELVGLLPRADLDRCSDEFLDWSGLDAECAVEARVGRGPRWLPELPDPDDPAL
jgi:glutamate formiminotransferase